MPSHADDGAWWLWLQALSHPCSSPGELTLKQRADAVLPANEESRVTPSLPIQLRLKRGRVPWAQVPVVGRDERMGTEDHTQRRVR